MTDRSWAGRLPFTVPGERIGAAAAVSLAAVLVLWDPPPVDGQEVLESSDSAAAESRESIKYARPLPSFTGPALPQEHWAVQAVARLQLLGLLEGHLPPQRPVRLEVIHAALEAAVERAPERRPYMMGVIGGWRARLLEEFPGLPAATVPRPEAGATPLLLGVSPFVGWAWREGAGAPGLDERGPGRTGVLPLPDRATFGGGVAATGVLGPHLGFHMAPEVDADGFRFSGLELAAGLGPLVASLGRLPIGYADGTTGGVTLGGVVPVDGFQVELRRPFRFPGAFWYLGDVSFTTFIARMTEERHPGDPFFWGGSFHVRPFRRLTLGVHRAVLFGGDAEEHPITAGNLLNMFIGRVAGWGFEDQIVSVSGRFILPTEPVLPLTAYIEWGAEDAAGAWRNVPGRVWGIATPAVPVLPQLSGGVEYSEFGASCCGNPPWYRHWSFPGSWASRDRVLGHPLGGEGSELSLFTLLDLDDSRLQLRGRAYVRERGEENLFSPGRSGRSRGFHLTTGWRPSSRTEVELGLSREAAAGWTEQHATLSTRMFF